MARSKGLLSEYGIAEFGIVGRTRMDEALEAIDAMAIASEGPAWAAAKADAPEISNFIRMGSTASRKSVLANLGSVGRKLVDGPTPVPLKLRHSTI